ncbi:MAG TPA: metallophosphoesterase [Methylomirabilota bacterium]|nr:metallophosphoesterase [Methylomirabilota bacterium]
MAPHRLWSRTAALRKIIPLLLLALSYPAVTSSQLTDAVIVGAGDIAGCDRIEAEATAKLLDDIAGTVFTAGDNAYPTGRVVDFNKCYDPTWGRHRSRTRPAPGNHDYVTLQATPYFNYFGASAGPPGRGYYSYNLGAWHIISLNSNTNASSWGKAQEDWLRQDLTKNPATCTLAYWHHPTFSSGSEHGNSPHTLKLFKILYQYGVSALISGHDHIYERFAPQNPDGRADPKGIREFIAGTGGAPLYKIGTIKPNSEVRNIVAHGVLKFTLKAAGYDWEFIPIAGQTFSDRGTARCSGNGGMPQ